ncbi:DUF6612 family protein [Alkalicoccus luteus]|uniref:DUF6612 family protein n=1 Tax=Alkalicoccus luteus TaxID=1237094 RepID=UPI0040344C6C
MKKSGALLCLAGAAGMMTACGTDESAEDVLIQSAETMEEAESYRADSIIDQQIEAQGETMNIHAESSMNITNDPMAFFQETTMTMEEMDDTMAYNSYFHSEDGFYMEDPMTGEWMKLPDDSMNDMLSMAEAQTSPEQQLEQLRDYVSDVDMEETDDEYVIHFSGEEIDAEELLESTGGAGIDGFDEMMMMMENIDFEDFAYTVHIDKETYYQTRGVIDITMSMEMMGETAVMQQSMDMNMYDFNEVEPIEIPQDVLDNAEEVDDAGMGGF